MTAAAPDTTSAQGASPRADLAAGLIAYPPPADAQRRRPARLRAVWLMAISIILSATVAAVAIRDKQVEHHAALGHRLSILAQGRADVLGIWLGNLSTRIERVASSDMIRLFAVEADGAREAIAAFLAQDDPPQSARGRGALSVSLTAQIPFMRQVLTDFVHDEDLVAGYLINGDGLAYVTSADAPPLDVAQQALVRTAYADGRTHIGPVRITPAGAALDVAAPVFPEEGEGEDPVTAALFSVPVSDRLASLLAPPPLARPGERLKLVQASAGELFEVRPGATPPLRSVDRLRSVPDDGGLPFAKRAGIGEGSPVFSVAAPVPGLDWWVVQEIAVEAAEAPLDSYRRGVISLAVLVIIAMAAAVGAFWWRLSSEHNAAMATRYRETAARIEAQKRLLDSINNTITDYIGLKGLDGTYRYVNPAFAQAMDREPQQAVGLQDAAVFGDAIADRLKMADQRALAAGAPVTIREEVPLGGTTRHLQITKIPFHGEAEIADGIVMVARDVSILVEAQAQREHATNQMVAALVRAVELREPHLAGHSRRVAAFAVAVARKLRASDTEIATIQIAANLSQVGKLGIARTLLAKPDRLSEAEIAKMRRHIDHAAEILDDVDFGLPVLETIQQMHERLDGSGYPDGLKGKEITRPARILAACDVFCARVEPRVYRQAISAKKALAILLRNRKSYDEAVVTALSAVVRSPEGRALMENLGAR